jgi:hypothetical protein
MILHTAPQLSAVSRLCRSIATATMLCLGAAGAAYGSSQELMLPAAPGHGADHRTGQEVEPGGADGSAFSFDAGAAAQLHALWAESAGAREERVACLGGYRSGGSWRVTAVERLAAAADSFGVSASTSIERCGPPQWLGTVHTHIAHRGDGSPYATFSGADRGVMALWWRRWRTAGVFCVLYTDRDAHCEADGQLSAGPGTRATY